MTQPDSLAGSFSLPNSSIALRRMGYGAMQLAGPGVYGPPRDPDMARLVLRDVIAAGVNHIDTSDYYGPHVTNTLIREALHPYPADLTLVTKVGARRGTDASWLRADSAAELTSAVHDNLRHLGLDVLDVVNYRVMGSGMGTSDESIEAPIATLAELQAQGLIRHVGLSNVTVEQLHEARRITNVVCVQNLYNVAYRHDEPMIDTLAALGIAYVPFFPLGGISPLQSAVLNEVASEVEATPMQVALAWLLQRAPNIVLIPGTSSREHLRENLAAATLTLPTDAVGRLNAIGTYEPFRPH